MDAAKNPPLETIKRGTMTILEPEAIEEVRQVWAAIHNSQETKGNYEFPTIQNISIVSNKVKTKSADESGLAYVINFENDEGFAVVRMNKEYEPIIALTESGSLDPQKLLNKSAVFENDIEELIYDVLGSSLYYEPEPLDFSSGVGPADTGDIEIGVWYTDTVVGPLTHTKWNQNYPFNMYMPELKDSVANFASYKGRYAAGCTMVAVCQMMVTNGHPISFDGEHKRFYLPPLKTISNYSNYSSFSPYKYDDITDASIISNTKNVADLLYTFGLMCDASNKPSGATGAHPDNAFKRLALLDNDYYRNYEKKSYSYKGDHKDLEACLDKGKPVVIYGYEETNESSLIGHSWLVDGYMYRHSNYSNAFKYTSQLFHFNWEYQGRYDGYYAASAIGISDRVLQDSTIDTNHASVSSADHEYIINAHYYTY